MRVIRKTTLGRVEDSTWFILLFGKIIDKKSKKIPKRSDKAMKCQLKSSVFD